MTAYDPAQRFAAGELMLRPSGFFDGSPVLDLPPSHTGHGNGHHAHDGHHG